MSDLREKLADILKANPNDYDAADAIIAALPDMVQTKETPPQNEKTRAPLQGAGYLYRSYDRRQWSGSRLCSILSRNHTTRRQPNQ